ncbi:MAG: hypothetical protein OEZ34_02050 [Spirochaetia bacterium]|nr:hypothetical protein [Spirochaetia bacterium]
MKLPAVLFIAGILFLTCRSTSSVTLLDRDDGLTNLISHEGNFSALMPVKPLRSVKKSNSKIGELENYIYYCIVDGENNTYVYLISYVDYPGNMILSVNKNDLIRNAIAGSMKRLVRSRLISQQPIYLQNNPGYEAIFTGYQNQSGKLVMAKERIFLVKNRMYILLMMTDASNSHDIADRFFNSFQITTNI